MAVRMWGLLNGNEVVLSRQHLRAPAAVGLERLSELARVEVSLEPLAEGAKVARRVCVDDVFQVVQEVDGEPFR